MILTAHQPAYLPWLGLIHKISQSDAFVIFDDVPMEGSGFENRNKILTDRGPLMLTVPVHRSTTEPIRSIQVVGNVWRKKHWGSLQLAYKRAPFWSTHEPWLAWVYEQRWERLADLTDVCLAYLLRYFRLQHVVVRKLSEIGPFTSTKSQLVLDVCKKMGAWKYVFGERGRGYADVPAFRAAGVEPFVQAYSYRQYPQQYPGFHGQLSAFDLIMNVDRDEAIDVMMAGGRTERM